MALKEKRFHVDSDGFVVENKTWREKLSEICNVAFAVISIVVHIVKEKFQEKWKSWGEVPAKLNEDEIRRRKYELTRDNIATMAWFSVVIIVMWKFSMLPTLWMATGLVEALAIMSEMLLVREAFRMNDDEMLKHAEKAGGKIFGSWLVFLLFGAIFSCLVLDGKLGSFTEYYPFLNRFAEWMVTEVNAAFQVFGK